MSTGVTSVAAASAPVLCTWQDPALSGFSVFPNDDPAGPREAGRMAPHLYHLPSQWHHWEPRQCNISTLQSRGGFPAAQGPGNLP